MIYFDAILVTFASRDSFSGHVILWLESIYRTELETGQQKCWISQPIKMMYSASRDAVGHIKGGMSAVP